MDNNNAKLIIIFKSKELFGTTERNAKLRDKGYKKLREM